MNWNFVTYYSNLELSYFSCMHELRTCDRHVNLMIQGVGFPS